MRYFSALVPIAFLLAFPAAIAQQACVEQTTSNPITLLAKFVSVSDATANLSIEFFHAITGSSPHVRGLLLVSHPSGAKA